MTIKDEAKQNFKNTDYALKLYNKVHQDQMNKLEHQPWQLDWQQVISCSKNVK